MTSIACDDREKKEEKERDELWKKLERLELNHKNKLQGGKGKRA